MIGWLFWKAHSATSIICFFVAITVVVIVGVRWINKNFGTYMLAGIVLIVAAELAFGISGHFSEALGRNATLSGRTVLWARLLEVHINPIFGTGFEVFWLGKRLDELEGIFFFVPNEAHNGYLEVYLNLGLLGLFIIIGVLIAAYWKIRPELFRNFEWGRYRLGFFVAVLLYNCTEAGFRILNPILLVFYLVAIHCPRTSLTGAQPPLESGRFDRELVYAEREP
jgi:O-antigen ligase